FHGPGESILRSDQGRRRRVIATAVRFRANQSARPFSDRFADYVGGLLGDARDFYATRGGQVDASLWLGSERWQDAAADVRSPATNPGRRGELSRNRPIYAKSAFARQRCDEHGLES